MRKIEFRGKRKSNNPKLDGKWEIGYLTIHEDYYSAIRPKSYMVEHEVYPETVGQYTALEDKNGAKIFEGDIVKIEGDKFLDEKNIQKTEPSYIAEIVHYRLSWDARKKDRKLIPLIDVFMLKGNIGFEVIGNIHDNQELLEANNA